VTAPGLLTAMCHVPTGFYVRFEREPSLTPDGSPDGEFLGATVWQVCPEGGWSVRGVDPQPPGGWHEVLGSTEPGANHPASRFHDRVLWGVTGCDQGALERLLVASILERWPTVRPSVFRR
jgi:hypothetical protein